MYLPECSLPLGPLFRLLRHTLKVQAQGLRHPDCGAHHHPGAVRLPDVLKDSSDDEESLEGVKGGVQDVVGQTQSIKRALY